MKSYAAVGRREMYVPGAQLTTKTLYSITLYICMLHIVTYPLLSLAAFLVLATGTPAFAASIGELAAETEELSSLTAALESQDLRATLDSEGPFTVFAPTNEAFAALPERAQAALEANPELLADILLYHVVPGERDAEAVLDATRLETAFDSEFNELAVQTTDDAAYVNTAALVTTDIEASNGIVHIIDTVLLPPEILVALADGHVRINAAAFDDYTDPDGNVWVADFGFIGGNTVDRGDISVADTDRDELFQTERWRMDAYEIPVDDGEYDVRLHFAETFSGVNSATDRIFDIEIEDTVDFADVDVFAEAGGFQTAITKSATVVVEDGALTIDFDRNRNNQMINAIEIVARPEPPSTNPGVPGDGGGGFGGGPDDTPDGPPHTPGADESIVDIASGDEDFSQLVDALVAEDLVETLSGAGPFTVFAPTNAAFEELPGYLADLLERKPALLSEILLYHVVNGDLGSDAVLSERRIETLQGESVRISQRGGGAFVNTSELTALDLDASNGVIHVLDRVLVPQAVYYEVLLDIRQQLFALVDRFREVQEDRFEERYPTR